MGKNIEAGKPATLPNNSQVNGDVRFVKRKHIEDVFDISRSSIYRMMTDKSFPEPIYLPGGGVRWIWSEVLEWAKQRINARNS
ncbi:helix-turn-helix transcriptional regulator [Endozoicomonas sp. ALB115]|uniref:helix-turn-helix transcriptional regulator n=1 Tax=Endozoicomonas sp. ALB115 TaxID=3403074 RepID=UPI003BB78DA5